MALQVILRGVLSVNELTRLRSIAMCATWSDGRETARGVTQKHNEQVRTTSVEGQQAASIILNALNRCREFRDAASPVRSTEPMLNRYRVGMEYGPHADARFMGDVRTDLAATLFLNEPADYEGGELRIGDGDAIKLPSGYMALYDCGELHRVTKVTRGERLAAVVWIQQAQQESTNTHPVSF